MKHTQRNLNQMLCVKNAWETGAPEAVFGGMTLEQFKELIKPALDSQTRLQGLQSEVVLEKQQLIDNAKDGAGAAKRAVNGMLADAKFGYDSPLYTAMGYVRASQRKSGLTRKTQAAAAVTQNAETKAES